MKIVTGKQRDRKKRYYNKNIVKCTICDRDYKISEFRLKENRSKYESKIYHYCPNCTVELEEIQSIIDGGCVLKYCSNYFYKKIKMEERKTSLLFYCESCLHTILEINLIKLNEGGHK